MIEWWQALILAVVQGLTEFLPISSSAHLILPTLLLGWPDQGLAFDVAVHLGTLLAVLGYFRRDLAHWVSAGWSGIKTRRMNAALGEIACLALASVPALLAGLFLGDRAAALRTLPVLAATSIVFAVLLACADRRRAAPRGAARVSWRVALFIGVAQAFALIPGTSRSGVTITAALLAGLPRAAAARFSFLLSIPIIAGAAALKAREWLTAGDALSGALLALAIAAAALTAYACIAVFLAWVERVGMLPFVVYRLLLGTLLFALWLA